MPTSAPHVLIMDDSPAILDLLREFLDEEGYRVTTSTTLLDVTHVAMLDPDLILLEWRFGHCPDAAWRFVLRLRLEPRLTRTPVVLCTTAHRPSTDHQIIHVLKHLQVAVVQKPCALEPLLRVMQLAMPAPSLRVIADANWLSPVEQGTDWHGRDPQPPQPLQTFSLTQGG